ncbi:MAG: FAD-dependent oxidoreductase [Bradymonadaceae bacterium]
MGLSFFEVMCGEMHDGGEKGHPFRIEVKAEAGHLATFALTGEVMITGIVDAPPWARQSPLEGTMRILPLRRREIAYEFYFTGVDGESLRFIGRKKIRPHRPITSFTRLSGVIEESGRPLATGYLVFDLAHLVPFMTSWWPSTSIAGRSKYTPRPGTVASTLLNEKERRILKALLEATFEAGEYVPTPDHRTLGELEEQLRAMPEHVVGLYRLGLRGLDAMALLTRRHRFSQLDKEDRRALLQELMSPTGPGSSIFARLGSPLLAQVLTSVPKLAHFGRADYLDAIGHPEPRRVAAEKPEKYMRRVVAAEDLEVETDIHAHVVVIGTGAGGAAVAYQLARQGLAVALVEEGRYSLRQDFTGSPMSRVHSLYRHHAANFTIGTPIVIPQGRAVGGTTTINSGTCLGTPDGVLGEWCEELGFPEDFRPDAYHRYTEEVAAMLQVAPGGGPALGRIAEVIARGADRMGLDHGPLPRNAPGCTGAGECILGCPEGAKRSTDVSYIPAALRAGAEIFVGLPVTRLLMDGEQAVAVEARGLDANGESKRLRVFADRVVVACGAIHSPLFLAENGFRLPWLGRNLSVHPALGLMAMMGEDLQPWNGIPQGYAVHALEEEGIRFEGYYLPPQLMASSTPWLGAELSRWMDSFEKVAQFGFMVRDEGDGRVRRGPDGLPLITYRLSPRSIDRLKKGASLLSELFIEAGAREVYAGFGRRPVVRSIAEARALTDVDAGPMDFQLLGAHPLGTCRMARDRGQGVVDFDHRVFGTSNVHVVDGSVVPTSLGVNPQMTIMAMALRAGDVLARKF